MRTNTILKAMNEFIAKNNIKHIVSEPRINKDSNGNVVGAYAYCNVGKKLYLKFFTKYQNFIFQKEDKIASQFTKDGEVNSMFEATLNKLQKDQPKASALY